MSSPPEKLKIGFFAPEAGKEGTTAIQGVNPELDTHYKVVCTASLPWLTAAEKAWGETVQAIEAEYFLDRDFVVNGSTVISLEGSGPLIPLWFSPEKAQSVSNFQNAYDLLCLRLFGREGERILKGEITSGVAVYDVKRQKGLFGERRVPFTCSTFSTYEEIDEYLRILSRITLVEIEIDKALQEQNYAFTPEIQKKIGQTYRDKNSLPPGINPDEELSLGMYFASSHPGGIYLGALIAAGKIRTVDGRDINKLSDEEIAHYVCLGRDANLQDANSLINDLQTGEITFETVYALGDWTRVYLEERRQKYPLFEFWLTERERLFSTPEEIWKDENLPPKVKRQLILQKYGIEINPHIHIPRRLFFEDYQAILAELFDLWKMPIGLSSALYTEKVGGRAPTAKFDFASSPEKIEASAREYGYKVLKYLPFESLDPRDHVILYPFIWDDKDSIVGGSSRFDTPPQLVGTKDRTIWITELQKGVLPRGIDPAKGGFVSFKYEPAVEVAPEIFETTGKRDILRQASADVTGEDTLLTLAEEAALKFTQNFNIQAGMARIMKITGKRPIAIDWYCRRDGKIMAVDF